MKPPLLSCKVLCAGLLIAAAIPSPAAINYSIGFHFGGERDANDAVILDPTNVVGLLPQANWNVLSGLSGALDNPNANVNGAPVATAIHLEWNANGTWASWGVLGENDGAAFQAANADRVLIHGYLDT